MRIQRLLPSDRAREAAETLICEGSICLILSTRCDDPLLVNIKSDISDTVPHDQSPMHEARHWPILTQEREDAAAEEQRLAAELRRIESGENALVAEESRQAAIASLTRVRDEALLYHAAACLLHAGLDRLRAGEDSGLLRRIGHAFSRITGGAYCGVDADEDEKGAPFLGALEAGAARTKRVAQLSEGTRDQLFLALRLVMLEDYAHRAPAPPFIADDLLQTFDDYSRTANALAALADLSQRVQVIVLSHHRRLADAARGLPEGIISVCDLAA